MCVCRVVCACVWVRANISIDISISSRSHVDCPGMRIVVLCERESE